MNSKLLQALTLCISLTGTSAYMHDAAASDKMPTMGDFQRLLEMAEEANGTVAAEDADIQRVRTEIEDLKQKLETARTEYAEKAITANKHITDICTPLIKEAAKIYSEMEKPGKFLKRGDPIHYKINGHCHQDECACGGCSCTGCKFAYEEAKKVLDMERETRILQSFRKDSGYSDYSEEQKRKAREMNTSEDAEVLRQFPKPKYENMRASTNSCFDQAMHNAPIVNNILLYLNKVDGAAVISLESELLTISAFDSSKLDFTLINKLHTAINNMLDLIIPFKNTGGDDKINPAIEKSRFIMAKLIQVISDAQSSARISGIEAQKENIRKLETQLTQYETILSNVHAEHLKNQANKTALQAKEIERDMLAKKAALDAGLAKEKAAHKEKMAREAQEAELARIKAETEKTVREQQALAEKAKAEKQAETDYINNTAETRRTHEVALEHASKDRRIQQHQITTDAETKQKETALASQEKRLKMALAGVPLGAAAVLGAYFGFKHYYMPRPVVIEKDDTSILDIKDRILGVKPIPSRFDDVILDDDLKEKVITMFKMLFEAIRQHLPLSNMMLYGPAGTGKTMAATAFLRRLNEQRLAHHVIVRGPAFKRLGSPEKAQNALAATFRWALQKSDRPVIFLFDEAETMFPDRDSKYANEMTNDLVTTILSFFERGINEKIMFILSTNYPDRIDRALLNRIDPSNRIRFTPPGQNQLEDLFKLYIDQHGRQKNFAVDEAINNSLPSLAKDAHGLVGRQIDSLVQQAIYKLLLRENKTLLTNDLRDAVRNATRQENLSAY